MAERYDGSAETHAGDGLAAMIVPAGYEQTMTELTGATEVCEALAMAWTADTQRELDGDRPASAPCSRLMTTDPVQPVPLGEACAMWQGGRDAGSSLLRGAARVLTGVPHYVQASYIADQEAAARRRPDALAGTGTLLQAVADADRLDADGWARAAGLPPGAFAGRGLKSEAEKDAQIEAVLDSGTFRMPLWGLSLDRAVTEQYGGRFLLEVVGPFPAVPAWLASGVVPEEAELISGGVYDVASVVRDGGRTHATLRWAGALMSG